MIRHIVFFRFKKDVADKEINAFMKELTALKKTIREVRDIEVAKDAGRKSNSYDVVLNSLFDSIEDVEKYAAHPAHLKVLETIKRICESTVKVDYNTKLVAM